MATTNPNDRDVRGNLNDISDVNTRNRTSDDARRDLADPADRDTNPDAITGAPGSHPVGTGIGAAAVGGGATAAGAAIGAAISGPAAPLGAVVGGVIGAVVGAIGGGYAGKAVAESVDPTEEDAYWKAEHTNRPYVDKGYSYADDYAPAYRHGWEGRTKHQGKTYEAAESDLSTDWERNKGGSKLSWDNAKSAVRDAWDRVSTKVDRAAYPDKNRPDGVRTSPPNELGMTASDPRNM